MKGGSKKQLHDRSDLWVGRQAHVLQGKGKRVQGAAGVVTRQPSTRFFGSAPGDSAQTGFTLLKLHGGFAYTGVNKGGANDGECPLTNVNIYPAVPVTQK